MNTPLPTFATPLPAFPTRQPGRALVMTDYGFLLALGLAMLVAVDPFEIDLERHSLTKHLPMLIALPSVVLAIVGSQIFASRQQRPGSLPAMAPLLALAAFIVIGGIYARFVLDIQNSFLVAGVYMLSAPMAAAVLLRCKQPTKLLGAFFALLALAGTVVFAGLAVNYGVRQVYHELEYLFPPLAVLAAFGVRKPWLRWAGIGFFLLLAFLFKKNTGYLTGLLVLGYLLVFYFWPIWSRKDFVTRISAMHWTLIAALLVAAAIAYFIMNRETYLPTGNPAFRLLTYENAWNRFLSAPLFGTAFTGPASEFFTGFDTGVGTNVLPTHSDVLDILANGGLLGISLWLWGLWRIARLALSTVLRPQYRGHPLAPYAHTLACISIAAIVTYVFNPIILQPGKSLLLWSALGFLVAIALMVRAESEAKAQAGHKNGAGSGA